MYYNILFICIIILNNYDKKSVKVIIFKATYTYYT